MTYRSKRNAAPALALLAAMVAGFAALPVAAAETTINDANRTDLALTVYGNGLGLVSDQRWAVLSKGLNTLSLEGLSPALITDSLITDFGDVAEVVGRVHRPAGPKPRDILRANIGKPGYLIRTHPETGADVSLPATPLAIDNGVIARIGGRVVINPEGRWAFDRLPADFRARPTLALNVIAGRDGRAAVALRYLTGGLKWHPVHTAEWSESDGALVLKSWAVIDNRSGMDFDQAWIRLVAGQVHRVSRPSAPRPMARAMKAESAMLADAAPTPQREALGGYHLYRLPVALSLHDGGAQQVALMPDMRLKATRQLLSEGYPQAFGAARGPGEPSHPVIRLAFKAPSGDQAQPLPAGTLRLYGRDRQGAVQFLGEDRIGDIPVGGDAKINAGRAFDVTVTRSQVSFHRESRQVFESAHRLTVKNARARDAAVDLAETLPGDWTIIESDHDHQRADGRALWRVKVPAGGEMVVNYRVRVRN